MSGWIKSHRKMLDNPIVCKDSDHLAVWMYILLHATHKEYPVVFAGEKISLQPGQLITGRKSISDKFNISESKVQRILKTFEIEHQIEQQSSNKNRLVTVLSWVDYQSIEQQDELPVNNKRTTTEQQVNTNKNVNKGNKVKKVKEEVIKTLYGDHVLLTDEQYKKLINDLTEPDVIKLIDDINYWFTQKPLRIKDYKDHNLMIRKWHKNNLEKKLTVIAGGQANASKPESSRQSTAAEYYSNDAQAKKQANVQNAAVSGGSPGGPQFDLDRFVRR